MKFTCGIDIGGTFTDCCIIDEDGRPTLGKSPSTPPEFHQGFLDALRVAGEKRGIDLRTLVASAPGRIFHGCTVGTNALVERKGAKVGLLTTRGHRDAIHIMLAAGRVRGLPPEQLAHVSATSKPQPLVPKWLIAEIDERVTWDGKVLVELNEETTREAIQKLLAQEVDAIAVSLLWSVVNSAHELAVKRMIEQVAPKMFVSLSSHVVRRVGEYERTVAAVINAYIGPVMNRYLVNLETGLAELGYEGSVQMMSCSGGLIDAREARDLPILTIGSGPVAGVIGSRQLSVLTSNGKANVIATDMGGTSFDVGVIDNGTPLTRNSVIHDQYEYFLPTVDVQSVGAGGGSIVYFDERSGTIRVGPESAGARPGPAAYGRGGTRATVTDADLMLGYLDPGYFLGGALKLDMAAARGALERAGSPLGFSAEETAAAAARIVDNHMADAIRLVTIKRGYDPRQFVIYSYGGAGPVHAAAYARELGLEKITIPLSDFAAGWSAFGVAASEAVFVQEAPTLLRAPLDPNVLNGLWHGVESLVLVRLRSQGIPDEKIRIERYVDMRYVLQINQVEVRALDGEYDGRKSAQLVEAFEQEYARLFGKGTGYAEAGFELLAVRVIARARVSELPFAAVAAGSEGGSLPLKGRRGVIWYEHGTNEREDTPVYDGARLSSGVAVQGPCIIELPDTTVVVRRGQVAERDSFGSLSITLPPMKH